MKTKFTDPKPGTKTEPSKRRFIPSKIDYGIYAITEMVKKNSKGKTRFNG